VSVVDERGASRRRGQFSHQRSAWLVACVLLVAAACAPQTPAASPTLSASAPASEAAASASSAPSPVASASATNSTSAAPSGPCVDVAELGDLGESVVTAMTGIKAALDAKKVDDARALVQTATSGMASMSELVGPASPAAKQLFVKAAAELTNAASQFPSGTTEVEQARQDLGQAFVTAQAAACAG
jgi:hypothetical protein